MAAGNILNETGSSNIFKTNWDIGSKYDTVMHRDIIREEETQNMLSKKIHRGGGRHIEFAINTYNSKAIRLVDTTFDVYWRKTLSHITEVEIFVKIKIQDGSRQYTKWNRKY